LNHIIGHLPFNDHVTIAAILPANRQAPWTVRGISQDFLGFGGPGIDGCPKIKIAAIQKPFSGGAAKISKIGTAHITVSVCISMC
jgi:hypothetical protein